MLLNKRPPGILFVEYRSSRGAEACRPSPACRRPSLSPAPAFAVPAAVFGAAAVAPAHVFARAAGAAAVVSGPLAAFWRPRHFSAEPCVAPGPASARRSGAPDPASGGVVPAAACASALAGVSQWRSHVLPPAF